MSSLNTKRIATLTDGLDDIKILERSVLSTLLWEKSFYENGVLISKRIQEYIVKCYNQNQFNKILEIIKKIKFDMKIRHTPLFCIRELVRLKLTLEQKKEIQKLLLDCITRADDITEFMVLYFTNENFNEKKQPIANFIKETLSQAFLKFDEYSLAKYAGYCKKISLKDVMCLIRPKPENNTQKRLFKNLIEKKLTTPDTWEVELSKSKDKKVSWERLLQENKLGGLALLRNIRNIKEAGVDVIKITTAIDNINAKMLLPINFIASAIHNPEFAKQLESKFNQSFTFNDKLEGKTLILLDVSSSMGFNISNKSQLTRRDVAGAVGIIANNICQYSQIYAFNDKVIPISNLGGFSLINTLKQYSGLTELYNAIQKFYNEDFDRIIVITDEQATDNYQSNTFNINKKYYIVNVASNKNGIEVQKREQNAIVRINGWSDAVIKYILEYEKQFN